MAEKTLLWKDFHVSRDLRPTILMTAGVLLAAAGLASWKSGLDLSLHHLLLLPGKVWPPRIVTLSALGGFIVMGSIGLIGGLILALRQRIGDGLWLLATIISGRLVIEGMKLLIMRPRPPLVDRLELVTSWSFPSSHSAGTLMTCLALAHLSGRRGLVVLAIATAFVIGWTRIGLGVHWTGDVLAGWGFGMLWVGLAIRFHPQKRESVGPA